MNEERTHRIDRHLAEWRGQMQATALWGSDELLELECHLLDHVEGLIEVGLAVDEAFLVATKRLGLPAQLDDEFSRSGSFARWYPRLFWMTMGSLTLLAIGSVNTLLVAPLLTIGVTRGMGATTMSLVAVAFPLALVLCIYSLRHRIGAIADAPRRRIAGLPTWVFWGSGVSALVFFAKVLPPMLTATFIDLSSVHEMMVATATGSLVWLVALPLLLAYATKRLRPQAA